MVSPHDSQFDSPRATLSGPSQTAIKRLLAGAGRECPVFRPDGSVGEDEGPLNDRSSDQWTESYFSDPSIEDDEGGGNDTGGWEHYADTICYRKYHDENDSEEDGRGVYAEDKPVLIFPETTPASRGDRIKYAGEVYELQTPTQYGHVVEFRVQSDQPGEG